MESEIPSAEVGDHLYLNPPLLLSIGGNNYSLCRAYFSVKRQVPFKI